MRLTGNWPRRWTRRTGSPTLARRIATAPGASTRLAARQRPDWGICLDEPARTIAISQSATGIAGVVRVDLQSTHLLLRRNGSYPELIVVPQQLAAGIPQVKHSSLARTIGIDGLADERDPAQPALSGATDEAADGRDALTSTVCIVESSGHRHLTVAAALAAPQSPSPQQDHPAAQQTRAAVLSSVGTCSRCPTSTGPWPRGSLLALVAAVRHPLARVVAGLVDRVVLARAAFHGGQHSKVPMEQVPKVAVRAAAFALAAAVVPAGHGAAVAAALA